VRREIRLPAVGEAIDGEVSEWYRSEHEVVQAGEALVAIDIDKVTIEVPSPAPGVLTIALPVGSHVALGEVLGWVTDSDG
jgi:2-oxoglutarate dehydrogenase E2 component (dihydrolipoamide succinyltransferase)